MEKERPKIGVGVIVKKGNTVLVGKRKNAHGDGTWSFPGGHLEFGESVEDCAKREVEEETGLIVDVLEKVKFTNDIFKEEGKHYVTLYLTTSWNGGDPEVREPDKCEEWRWVKWEEIPRPLFVPIENLLSEGFNPFN